MNAGYVRDLLKLNNNLEINRYFCGKIDNKYEKSICVYDLKDASRRNIAISGEEMTTGNKKFSILIRWNKNYLETSEASENIYNYLTTLNHLSYNNIDINYVELLDDAPIDLHCGDDGIYERLIDLKIYYKEIK
jgi:hypothetical protein